MSRINGIVSPDTPSHALMTMLTDTWPVPAPSKLWGYILGTLTSWGCQIWFCLNSDHTEISTQQKTFLIFCKLLQPTNHKRLLTHNWFRLVTDDFSPLICFICYGVLDDLHSSENIHNVFFKFFSGCERKCECGVAARPRLLKLAVAPMVLL